MLCVFEDTEAVIKMNIQSRSPTMRHVSRAHRLALDWLFDKINVDPKIQIRYIYTIHQLADVLAKSNFARDEWNNLLHLFNTSNFSSTWCTKNFSLISCSTMAKRIQNQKEEERVVSKSRPAVMNMSLFFCHKFLLRIECDCIQKAGDADSFGETRQQDECWTKLIRRRVDISGPTQGCIPLGGNGRAAVRPVASRRRRFTRLRQS